MKNFQDIYFDGRNDSTYWHTYSCDFVQLARGYNQHADNIRNLAQLSDAIDYFILHQKPMLLEIDMEHIHECRPRLAFGDKLDSQSPKLLPDTKSSS